MLITDPTYCKSSEFFLAMITTADHAAPIAGAILSLVIIIFFSTACNSDPDLLLDFCIADTTAAAAFHFNGLPCIDPATARADHFATSALSRPTDSSGTLFGFNATMTSPAASLPGANAQGLAMARVDLAPGGMAPLHSHPRASEVALVLSGGVLVGFADTSYRLYTQRLRAGEAFVFPRGMVHFMRSEDTSAPAVVLSGLNSQSPGAQLVPFSAFLTEPRLPDEVVKKTFRITGQDVQRIQRSLGGS
ncbi:germin-like protein 3-1 [Aegilops tauschii subsp. strangulata]|uniref:Germin-like protein n=1 Tax=Aegilops tauschii subsp. strangulata TaxID=200361 RepID=A0A453IX41_AEGTS|nr:germin-like protein 3-1 [Aegilops tauschii subsp. strangulata]